MTARAGTVSAQPGAPAITADLMARLQRHYIKPGQVQPGGVFLPEVGWNAVGGRSRADALYVGFTSTSGRLLVGHEVKATRADWLSELGKPAKADDWCDQCHAWYLVTVPGVVADGELPDGWGLMYPGRSRTRMTVVTTARVHRDRQPSWHAARSIMARLDTLQVGARDRIRTEERQRVAGEIADAQSAEQRWMEASRQQTDAVRHRLRVVEQALGVTVTTHDDGNVLTAGPERLRDMATLLAHHRSLQSAVDALADRYGRPPTARDLRAALDALDTALQRARDGLPPASPARVW